MHYSYTDYLSQSSRGRTLIPGFNNSLDDLWQSIDSSILLNKKFTIELLRTSNPEFLKVNSATTIYLLNGISLIECYCIQKIFLEIKFLQDLTSMR